MKQVPDRKRLRREYLRKRKQARVNSAVVRSLFIGIVSVYMYWKAPNLMAGKLAL